MSQQKQEREARETTTVIDRLQELLDNSDHIYYPVRMNNKTISLPLTRIEKQRTVANFFIGALNDYKEGLKAQGEEEDGDE